MQSEIRMEAVINTIFRRFGALSTRLYSISLLAVISALAFSLSGCDNFPAGTNSSGSGPTAVAAPIDYAQEKILVGSYNIQVFGRAKLGKNSVTAILVDVARKFDVLAIQELRSTDQSIVPRFVEMINSTGRKFEYIVGPRQGLTVSTEQYVYIYDSERVAVISQPAIANDPSGQLHRSPMVARFQFQPAVINEMGERIQIPDLHNRPGFSFSLMNIHVDPDEVKIEHPALVQLIQEVRSNEPGEDDFVLAGDLNAPPRYFEQFDWFENQFAAIPDEWSTKPRQNRNIDNLVFDRIRTAEFTGETGVMNIQEIYQLSLEEALLVSDHYPVWATFDGLEAPVASLTRDPKVVR